MKLSRRAENLNPSATLAITAKAKQMKAERERRAKVIHAEGEAQASTTLVEAANTLSNNPRAMTLRYLQTLTEFAGDKNSTLVFPLPVELIKPLIDDRD